MGNQTEFKLSIEGGGLSVKKEIDQEVCRRILNVILGGVALGGPIPVSRNVLEQKGVANHSNAKKEEFKPVSNPQLSLREFLDAVNARKNPEKIIAFGYYITEAGQETFTPQEVRECFSKAAEKKPANYFRDFAVTVKNGWISEKHNADGQYYVTSTGQKIIRNKFGKEKQDTKQ